MALTITPESKNSLAITPEDKPSSGTFGEHPEGFGENAGAFGTPGIGIVKETKNNLTITNETKP